MSEEIVIYDGPDACTKCLGWKKIANDDDQLSWKHWAELPPPSNIAVQLGLVFPIDCPRCLGTGKEPSAAERSTRLHHDLDRLQAAWDNVSSCADEFGTDAADACAEYRDQLDTAILAVLQAWKETQ
jgi:hypothetical protein